MIGMGVAVLIANWTRMGNSSVDYAGAAQAEIQFLLSDAVRKTSDGAFSHRIDQLQLWYVVIAMPLVLIF